MLNKYLVTFGIIILIAGIIESLFNNFALSFWIKWINNKYYFLHGLFLIIIGFPLTLIKNNYFESIIFIIGLIFVFTGPFILIYPEKIKKLFNDSIIQLGIDSMKNAIKIDGIFKIIIGIICILSYFKKH